MEKPFAVYVDFKDGSGTGSNWGTEAEALRAHESALATHAGKLARVWTVYYADRNNGETIRSTFPII